MAGYDPKKAATYNQLRQQGLSEEAAQAQAGIKDGDAYVIGEDGKMGSWVDGWGKSTNGAFQPGTVEKVPYTVKSEKPSSARTSDNYTDTSTTQLTGKSTFIAATKPKDTAASQALQPQIDAKQAELNQFVKENPSNFERKVKGLPPMTPEEQAAREKRYAELSDEKFKLKAEQNELKTPGEPARFETPNTTGTDTTTYGKESINTPVESPDSADPAISQQTEQQLAGSTVGAGRGLVNPPLVQPDADAGAGRGFVNPPLVEPAPQEIPVEQTLAPGEELVQATDPTAAQSPYASQRAQQNEQIESASAQDQPDPYDNRFSRQEADAAEAASNESTAETARLNRGEAAAEAAAKQRAQEQAALQARLGQTANGDWRVRLRLAPNATYLYKAADPGILAPLSASDGVIFPYTPSIVTSYNANYDTTDLTHSNYRGQFYKNSNTGDVSLTGTFTAQDTAEAEYMLAVIHFFRSVTKMFYGQDAERGAPPPLVYLSGFGPYQFNGHPCVVKSFNYTLPTDVDYVRVQPNNYGVNLLNRRVKQSNAPANTISSVVGRLSHAVDLLGNILKKGALPGGARSNPSGQPGVAQQAVYNTSNSTYVPTKIEIQLTLLPIQTRNQVSQQFGLKDYANGALLRGGFW